MKIELASKELYSKLRYHEDVVGMGVSTINGIQYIVIYLAKISTFISKIPKEYKGNRVKQEIVGNIELQ